MPLVLAHRHTALCALSFFVALQFTRAVPTLQENHASSQVRKSWTARKDSVRRPRALLSPLVPTKERLYNGNFLFMYFFFQSHRPGRIAGFLFLAFLATVSAHSQERADCR